MRCPRSRNGSAPTAFAASKVRRSKPFSDHRFRSHGHRGNVHKRRFDSSGSSSAGWQRYRAAGYGCEASNKTLDGGTGCAAAAAIKTKVSANATSPAKCGREAVNLEEQSETGTLCYAIVIPGRRAAFRAGFWPDGYRESTETYPPAGRRAEFGALPVAVRLESVPKPKELAFARFGDRPGPH